MSLARHDNLSRSLSSVPATALVLAAITLCSCRAVQQGKGTLTPDSRALVQRASVEAIPPGAQSTTPHMPIECVPQTDLPIPVTTCSPWAPPGISGPWPHDEYLHDGGDRDVQVNITSDRVVQGLELEDTVVIYDTMEGDTVIEPSNRVCLYAPRFGAVRKVNSVIQNEQREQLVGASAPIKPIQQQEDQLATTAIQPIQPEGEIGRKSPSIERVNEAAMPANSRLPVMALQEGFAPHEDFRVMRLGIFEESERAHLLEAAQAAITWSHDQAVQVVLDGRAAVSVTNEQSAQETFRVDLPNHPCLRVIKTASTKVAKPGDIVDFTIRFDNMGDTAINNVVLMDNLTTRLEYVPGSAQASRDADFTTDENEGESLVLRWEFRDPLPVGKGGLVRFHCRVR